MTLKQLLSSFTYADLRPTIERLVAENTTDLRPTEVKLAELEAGYNSIASLKPSFGYIDVPVDVKMLSGKLIVSNTHLGSNADLLSHQVKIAPGIANSESEIAAHIIYQLVAHENQWKRYREEDDFDDIDNIQTGGMLR